MIKLVIVTRRRLHASYYGRVWPRWAYAYRAGWRSFYNKTLDLDKRSPIRGYTDAPERGRLQ